MSLKANPEKDPIILNSDCDQSLEELNLKIIQLEKENKNLKYEGSMDYKDMRSFQEKFINSDQSLRDQKEKLNIAIMALKDISIWCEDLYDARAVARYCLEKIETQ